MSTDPQLAPYAILASRGREHAEPEDPLRGPFALDRHRIVNSTAFRRLDGKTQVFAPQFHDHFRNRLEHTLEVAGIARTLARALRVNEDLVEAVTLAHDLGHPPFGHAGELALSEAMTKHGGFNHNAHSLRVVEYLEHPYPAFRGLNLSQETLDGLRLHETKFDQPAGRSPSGPHAGKSPRLNAASVETQIASLADRVAYDCHDLEDAIGAGFVGAHDLRGLTLWRAAGERVSVPPPGNIHAIRRVVLDTMLDALLLDSVETSRAILAPCPSADEALAAGAALVRFSQTTEAQLLELERSLAERVYRRSEIAAADARGRQMIGELFAAYRRSPDELPERFRNRLPEQGIERVICDYIAGMTDRFCTREHARLVIGEDSGPCL